jgi:antirestriction protein
MFKIYVTNLGKYNEGYLIGKWLTLPATEEEVSDTLKQIGINEYYEEYFITDYESDIMNFKIDEYDNINDLNDIAEELESLSDYEQEVVEALLEYGYTLEDAIDKIDDCIVYYNCDTMEEVAERIADENGLLDQIPENLQYYFDFSAYGRDLEIEGTFIFTRFNNCVEVIG